LVAGLFVCGKSVLAGRQKRCGVVPPPTKLHEAFAETFKKASGYTQTEKFIFIKVFAQPFSNSLRLLAS